MTCCCSRFICSIRALYFHTPFLQALLGGAQALVFEGNTNVRDAAAISLDPVKHFRPPSFEEGILR